MTKKVQCLLVGGAVRDKLLGNEPKDLDYVVVGADVQYMLDQGFKQVGASFPVFLHPETGDEYALARREKKVAAGYQGFEFEFGPHIIINDDLLRRDLTINAIAYNLETGEYIDPWHGRQDLKDGIIRHTSEAFAEDPLRVIRVARFASRYRFKIAPETVELCRKLVESGELDALSADRIWTEMTKLLSEKRPSIGINFLLSIGALHLVERLKGLVIPCLYTDEVEEILSLDEKQFLFLEVGTMTKEQLEKFRVPSDVARYCKFMQKVDEIFQIVRLSGEPEIEQIVKVFDAFREEIKNGDLYNMITLTKKLEKLDRFDDKAKDFFTNLENTFNDLLELDFTEMVKGLKPSEIKSFVLKTKSEIVRNAFIGELKSCPFCGSQPNGISYSGQPATSVYVSCNCGACGPSDTGGRTGSGAIVGNEAVYSAIALWNKRK